MSKRGPAKMGPRQIQYWKGKGAPPPQAQFGKKKSAPRKGKP